MTPRDPSDDSGSAGPSPRSGGPRKIGLFGGTFNPIHRCHLLVASAVRDRLGLDRILFIPTGDPPHKAASALAPAADRLEMVRLALADIPEFSVSDLEVARQGRSYSIDTVRALQRQYPADSLYFILGLDAFLDFPTWREPEALLSLCHFVVVSRPGSRFQKLEAFPRLFALPKDALVELDAGRREILTVPTREGRTLTLLSLPPCDASASDIRRRVREHRPLSKLLPAPVESYIIRRRLYQEDADHPGV